MKRKQIIISIIILIIIGICQKSYAAIEIKPSPAANASKVMVNSSVSNSYLLCQNMTKQGESLYGSTVLPHLSTNTDWGAVSYLSNSIYGTNSEGKNKGLEVTIDGITYYSTTGNASGVMNWGVNYYKAQSNTTMITQTSSLITKYVNDNTGSTAINYVTELEKAAKANSRYVDIVNTESFTVRNTLGMCLAEVKGYPWGQWGIAGKDINYPITIRQGLFGFYVGNSYSNVTSGAGSGYSTFRPVIWNK